METNKRNKGLMIIAKDVDAYLANHIMHKYSDTLEVEIVTLKHRDKLEFEKKFKNIKAIHSLPEYAYIQKDYYSSLSISEIEEKIEQYTLNYQLKSVNRYIHYDFFRSIKKTTSRRDNYIRILIILDFFQKINIDKFDFAFGELSRSYYVICHDIMQSINKLYLSPTNIGILKGILYVDDQFQIINFDLKKKLFLESEEHMIYLDKAKNHIENFIKKPKYNYTFLSISFKNNLQKLQHSIRKSKNLLLEIRSNHIDSKYRFDYIHTNPILRVVNREIVTLIKSKIINYFFFNDSNLKEKNYIFFPLHVHPETTTSLFSEYSMDHISQHSSTIEYLSKSIPCKNKLLIKEHPAMIGHRKIKFYSYYKQFYNIDLVGPKINQFDAIDKSDYIITLCGTIGLEALFKDKKVITLANSYYNYFRGIKNIKSINQFPSMFQDHKDFYSTKQTLTEDFAFLMYCTHFNIVNFLIEDNIDVISKNNLDLFVKSIQTELKLHNISKL